MLFKEKNFAWRINTFGQNIKEITSNESVFG